MEALHLAPLLLLTSTFPSVEPQWFWINLHVAGPPNGISVVPTTSHPNLTRNTILKTTNHPCSTQIGCIYRTTCISHACPVSERLHECVWPANQDCEGTPCACSNVIVQQRVVTTQPPASNTTTSYTPAPTISPAIPPCNIQFGCIKPGICVRNGGHCPVDHQLDQCHWPVDQPSCNATSPCACQNSLVPNHRLNINESILNHTTPRLSRFS